MQRLVEKPGDHGERRTTSVQTGARILLDFSFSCRDEVQGCFQQKLPVFAVFRVFFDA